MRTPGGQSVWLGLTSLKREWLGPGEVTVLTLRAAVLGAGVYLLDGYRVSLCAWRTGASQPEQPFSPPVACPLPRCATRSRERRRCAHARPRRGAAV